MNGWMESSNIVDSAAPPYRGMVIHCFIWLLPVMATLQMLMTLSVPPAPRSSAKCTLLLLIIHDEHTSVHMHCPIWSVNILD